MTGEGGTVTGFAKTVTTSETGLKEAAGVAGGQPASVGGTGQWGCVEGMGVYPTGAKLLLLWLLE